MADKKISQLTNASTPLAGTEVLPIVQSGNTVKVSVANLTAGRAVSASSVTSSGAITSQSSSIVSRTSTGGSFVLDSTVAGQQNTITGLVDNGNLFGTINYVGVDHVFKYGGTEVFRAKSDGNVAIANGNLQISTAAKGIDFSANTHAAGMTSELLDWYEEGTWTPTATAPSGAFTTVTTSGTYTRMGNIVRAGFRVTIANIGTATAISFIGGLPFASSSGNWAAGVMREQVNTGVMWQGIVSNSTTSINVFNYNNSQSISNGAEFVGSIVYECA
jgi:hypothetical protein